MKTNVPLDLECAALQDLRMPTPVMFLGVTIVEYVEGIMQQRSLILFRMQLSSALHEIA